MAVCVSRSGLQVTKSPSFLSSDPVTKVPFTTKPVSRDLYHLCTWQVGHVTGRFLGKDNSCESVVSTNKRSQAGGI